MNKEMCVEYWKIDKKESGSWAQMSENLHYIKPDPKDIQRRFFDTHDKANKYAQQKNTEVYHAVVKEDRSL